MHRKLALLALFPLALPAAPALAWDAEPRIVEIARQLAIERAAERLREHCVPACDPQRARDAETPRKGDRS